MGTCALKNYICDSNQKARLLVTTQHPSDASCFVNELVVENVRSGVRDTNTFSFFLGQIVAATSATAQLNRPHNRIDAPCEKCGGDHSE
jgi:hypothetical protein